MSNNSQLRNVKLYGKLGARFGRLHKLAVSSPAEAVSALCNLFPGFERELLNNSGSAGYVVFVDRRNLGKEDLFTKEQGDIRLAPVTTGSKSGGLGQMLLGAVIVVAAVWTGGLAGAVGSGAGSFMGVTGGYAIAAQMGMAMALGGVVQMLSPQPKAAGSLESPENGTSYSMNGTVNTMAQGGCVPLAYGRVMVGSSTVSLGLYAEDQK